MATAIVGVRRGYQYYADKIARAKAQCDKVEAALEESKKHFEQRHHEAWESVLAGRMRPQAHNMQLWDAYHHLLELRKHRYELEQIEKEAPAPDTPDRFEIAVIDSYDMKDALKARGYKFTRDARHATKPAWVIAVDTQAAKEEAAWLHAQGIAIQRA